MPKPAVEGVLRVAVWALALGAALVPLAIAATDPLLASRDAIWVLGGMAGIVALALLLFQPLLIGGVLPGMSVLSARRWHRWIGGGIVLAIVVHVGGLYLTSPEDVTDALLLVSPTPFALYGVIGLWGTVSTAILAAFRRRIGLRPWRIAHTALAVIVVASSVVHTLLIDGAMGPTSKLILCLCVLAATTIVAITANRSRTTKTGSAAGGPDRLRRAGLGARDADQ